MREPKIELRVSCRWCRAEFSILVYRRDLFDFNAQERHAQDCFPYLTPDERELLISQTCGTCWAKMFPPDEEE